MRSKLEDILSPKFQFSSMTLQEIIEETVIALYGSKKIKEILVLKGGTALNISEKLQKRLSKDIDFSVSKQVQNPEEFFNEVEAILKKHFKGIGYELFNFRFKKRPKKRREAISKLWGGYEASFKLIPLGHNLETIEDKRRNAMMPRDSGSTNIRLDISEYEYCEPAQDVEIRNAVVRVYPPSLLILEKLRAICQQHPEYPYSMGKNRARDFYDIYQLFRKHRSEKFFDVLKENLPKVFKAKNVNENLLKKIFQPDFLQLQEDGFKELLNTGNLSGVEDFTFYVEQLKLLLTELNYSFL